MPKIVGQNLPSLKLANDVLICVVVKQSYGAVFFTKNFFENICLIPNSELQIPNSTLPNS